MSQILRICFHLVFKFLIPPIVSSMHMGVEASIETWVASQKPYTRR